MEKQEKKIIKAIRIDANKCTGCRACEEVCSAFHAKPKYSIVNPKRSRIRVFWDEGNDVYVPVLAGHYIHAECNSRSIIVINGKSYGECSFCRASCPSRNLFKEPDCEIPLKCDMCIESPQEKPLCVQWCLNGALVYEEREEVIIEDVEQRNLEIALESLVDKYGFGNVKDTAARMAQKG